MPILKPPLPWSPRALAAAAACIAGAAAVPTQSSDRPFALAHVTVVDVAHATERADMTVVVARGRIVSVAPSAEARPGAEVRVVDAAGKYLIPGLWDMHVHLGVATEPVLPVLVAAGITSVRDMGTRLDQVRAWRRAIDAGRLLGPRIVAAGAIIDGPGHPSPEKVVAGDAARARALVDSLADEGADFIKVYEFLSPEAYAAIVREAAARRLAVVGHVPRDVGPVAAADAGQRSIEHLSGVPLPCPASARFLSHVAGGVMPPCGDDRARADAFAHFRRDGTWVVPTLVKFRGLAAGASAPTDPRVPAALRARWAEQVARWPRFVPESYRRMLPKLYEPTAAAAHRAGVPFLAGSDLGNMNVVPGAGLHDELTLLVGAGLTPAEALRAATRDAAFFLGAADSLGTVEQGKLADLVLLDADPLADIANVRRIAAVISRGRLLERRELEAMVERVAGR